LAEKRAGPVPECSAFVEFTPTPGTQGDEPADDGEHTHD